ncbi:zinc finger protein 462-like isoform X2 [Festucalex cinctus]
MTSYNGIQKEGDADIMQNQDGRQEQPSQSFRCSHCQLKFKSEVFLVEHVCHVHGSDLDLNSHANNDSSKSTLENPVGGLQTDPSEDLNHLEDGKNLKGDVTQKLETEMAVSAKHHDEEKEHDDEAHLITPSRVTLNLSRDLKTYKKPPQTSTISNYFTIADGQQDESDALADDLSDDESNVTPATIDISSSYTYLKEDHLYVERIHPIIEAPALESKKTSNTKKTPEATDKKELSFEVSEDDEDEPVIPLTYSSEDCDHQDDEEAHLISTSKVTLNSSTDLKTYTKPLQTSTVSKNFMVADSQPDELENQSDDKSNVTPATINIYGSQRYLKEDHLYADRMRPIIGAPALQSKKTSKTEKATPEATDKKELSFEVSDDEDKRVIPLTYSCKDGDHQGDEEAHLSSTSKGTLNSSRELKTYTKPLQTSTVSKNFMVADSQPDESENQSDDESNNATPATIDIYGSQTYSKEDHLYDNRMRPIIEPLALESKKTTNTEKTTPEATDKKELSFEVSEEDEDKRVSPLTYSCKDGDHQDDEEAHLISTSKVTLNSSRDLKTYTKPLQTSTVSKNVMVADSQPDKSVNQSDNESNNITPATIDIYSSQPYSKEDHLYVNRMRPIIETPALESKKTSNTEKTTPEATDKKELSFEVSEEDEDKRVISLTYSCKDGDHQDDKEAHLISTSKVTLNSSTDLKTYTKPLQTSTVSKNFMVTDSQPDESENQSDDESNNVTPATTDISRSHPYLKEDRLYVDRMCPIIEAPALESKKTYNTEKTTQEATNKELSFEVSGDDEDKRVIPQTYSCKHCNHKDDDLNHMSVHYRKTHPFVCYNSDYIQDENDQSATFRCLVCPIEFLKEDDLRKHYGNKHAGSPDIFTLGLDQINLVFKCFTCRYNTDSLGTLKEHYNDRHPPANALNALMFLKYMLVPCQEDPPPIKSPASEALQPNVALYVCNKCPFRHKSVIVLQVHYQKNHPEEAVTIDKIKRQAGIVSNKRPGCPSSKAQTKNNDKVKIQEPNLEYSISKKVRESSEAQTKTKYKVNLLEAKSESSTSEKVRDNSEVQMKTKEKVKILKAKSESSTPGKGSESSQAQTKSTSKVKIVEVKSESSLPESVEKISKVQMQNKGKVKIEEVKLESFVPEKVDSVDNQSKGVDSEQTHKAQGLVQNQVPGATSSNLNGAKPKGKSTTFNVYGHAENLFFCYKCNYGNPTIKGVMVHQFRTHDKLRTSSEDIVNYTTKVHSQLQKYVAQAENQSFSPLLPLPILNEGDEHTFFCHLCHYRRSTVSKVVQHYASKHSGLVATPKQIQSYTFRTLELLQNTVISEETQHKKTTNKKTAPQKLKSLQCKSCVYKTHNPNLFRIHVLKCQRENHSSSGVLKVYLKQAGYQCDLCAFSHKKSTMLYKHYRQEHPESRSSLDFITTRLKEGYKSSQFQKKNQIRPDLGNEEESNASGGQSDTRMYSCRACSFKESSVAELKDHYRAVHPWCLKENGSRKKSNSGKNNRQKPFGRFDDYQIPLKSLAESPSLIQADGNSMSKESERSVDMDEHTHQHVFKCPYCTYVNTKHQGVLTHCQMRHSALQSRADSLYVDEVHFRDWDKKQKGQEGEASHFRGYMCELCPQTHETEKKLRRHHETDHGETPPHSTAAPDARKTPAKIPKGTTYKIKMTLFRCQQCSYSCSNKMAFSRHMRLKHKGTNFQVCRYNCVLCSNSYFKKKRLGSHYKNKHGQDAYLKYFSPLYEHPPDNPPPEREVKASTKSKRLVYKCPLCPYVNSRPHGMATHCQMMHPDLTVRISEFERSEISISSNYQSGSNNKRGYLCDMCQGICMSLKKLAIHCSKKHTGPSKQEKEEPSEPSEDAKSQESVSVDANPNGKPPKKVVFFKCLLCCYSSVIRKRLAVHYTTRHGKAAFHKHFAPLYLRKVQKAQLSPEIDSEPSEAPPDGEELLYKCQLCEYRTWARRYLTYHYNKTHQLDAETRDKLLMAYNKRKRPPSHDLPPDSEQSLQETEQTFLGQCKKCPYLSFDSPQQLLSHYCAAHCAGLRMDFTVVYPVGRSTGVYWCTRCNKTINGIRTLSGHLDRHREKSLMKVTGKKKMATPLGKKTSISNLLDTPAEGLLSHNAPLEVPPLVSSLVASPAKAGEPEQMDIESLSESHACSQCQRTFKSRNGLRTHKRSHEALAAIKKLPASLSQLNLNKYLLHKPGTVRPFQCSICFYRTNLMGLWTNHLLKNHLAIVLETCDDKQETSMPQSADTDPPNSGSGVISLAKANEGCTKDWYLESPEVRRQLSHLSLMAQNGAATMPATRQIDSGGLFRCENCSFFCDDLSSMRRHYLSKHGRKMYTCKDCDFFTGLKRAMRVHMDTGHSTFQKEAPPQDGFRCPFCLYQTNNKNNMIDHVLLHREERVVPMEVRRPKLSRYLQGLVFRCHVCTYTSASADNLRLHAAKHECVKPYRCRLCYFDCAKLDDLEAHLCSKHQVMRNHELVGQVNLEQMEQAKLNERPENEDKEEEEAHRSSSENTEDFFSHVETDDGKPTEEESSDRENHLPETTAVKQEHHNDAGPPKTNGCDHSQLPPENREETEGTVAEEMEELSPKEHAEKDHHSKLLTPNMETRVENDILEPDGESRTHGKEPPHADFSESSGKASKMTLNRETSAPLLDHYLEPPREDKAHKRKLCEGLMKEEEEEQDCEGQKKRIKMEDSCTRQDGDMSELKGAGMNFSCNFCGRYLQSEEELQRHASRHRM